MKIKNNNYGKFTVTPETETLEDIAVAVIMASYELAIPFGAGFLRNNSTLLTKEMATEMLNGKDISHDYATNNNKKNNVDMDYVFGRCCKTIVSIENDSVRIMISERDRNPLAILERAKELLK